MQRSKIKGIEVSKIALGTWAIGGGRDWGKNDDSISSAAILRALESGINFIDTAPIYGNYHAETLLAKTLKGKRHQVVLATKCGLTPAQRAVKHDLSPKAVRQEIEASLKRLETDYIDFYFIHWPDRNTPLQDTLAQLTKLKQEGKIRQIGVSNFTAPLLEQAAQVADIAIVQNEYSFLKQEAGQSVFSCCAKHNIAFMGYGPLAGGILSGKYNKEPNLPNCDVRSFFYKFYKGDSFETSLKAVKKMQTVAQKHNATAAQAAINWALANPAVTCVAAGVRTPKQAQDIADALKWQLSKEDLEYLNDPA